MRLDKFLCDTSPLSRSDAKKAIKAKRVMVNGQLATGPNQKITNSDDILLDNHPLALMPPRYFMLNKPTGYVSATQDADHPTVLDLLQEPLKHQLHVAGRLDKDTTGLLLITDDGQWSHKVTSPKQQCHKRYRVCLAEEIQANAIEQLQAGILLNNEAKPCKPALVEVIDPTTIFLTISEGKYHQVKRMLAAVGNHVTQLHRDRVGTIHLDESLAEGSYRELTTTEIANFNQPD